MALLSDISFNFEFDTGKWHKIVHRNMLAAMNDATKRLIQIMEKEVLMTTSGGAPGRSAWREEMASKMEKVFEEVTDSLISYGIGIKSTSNFKDMLKAWIVTDGTGSAAGNPPIQAGQKGRWVFDKNLDLKPSEVKTHI